MKTPSLSRRHVLALAALAGMPAWAARGSARTQLIAAWQTPDAHHIGVLAVEGTRWSVQRSLAVPTRAHGLLREAGGSVLAAARRPGDWLLRWHPGSGQTQWHWIEDDRRFNGHAITSPDGQTLWTTETELDHAQGRLAVRDIRSLEKRAEWPTHGMDPHELIVLPQALGELPAGSLLVANGGIPTLPETGRSKRQLDRMDASLVALDPRDGRLLGQWRLGDPFLSIRHLIWDPVSTRVGIALQAEHPDAEAKRAAPVFALWDGTRLQAASGQPPVMGYGGDICALPEGGFVVSCPRADALALFSSDARWLQNVSHREAYALASDAGHWWASGAEGVWCAPEGVEARSGERLQIDNHWQVWPRA
ncbi:DUF1513 domain-containing protein [Hydrogenophaga palleronii]|uniref:DUF1513 domain-containing protein n=1 Tax=Hydrogenophaga palleronii TaxID=65655 RepID=UPI0009FCBFE3|nr:DUF1513 domain-containing protein [Hydrogenophaga palleronii]